MFFRDEEKQQRMRRTLDDETLKRRIEALDPRPTKYDPTPIPDPNEGRIGITRINPMSPYIPPVSAKRYANIVDVINNKPFKAVYPQSFTPISQYFLRNRITPYFNPGPDSDLAPGSITIAGMIDLIYQNLPLILEREEDIEHIRDLLYIYKNTFEGHPDKKIQVYLKKVDKFLGVLEEARAKMYRRHGKTTDPTIDLMQLFRQFNQMYHTDP